MSHKINTLIVFLLSPTTRILDWLGEPLTISKSILNYPKTFVLKEFENSESFKSDGGGALMGHPVLCLRTTYIPFTTYYIYLLLLFMR